MNYIYKYNITYNIIYTFTYTLYYILYYIIWGCPTYPTHPYIMRHTNPYIYMYIISYIIWDTHPTYTHHSTQLPLAAIYVYVYIKGVPQLICCSPVEVKGAIVQARKEWQWGKLCQQSNFNIYQIIILYII